MEEETLFVCCVWLYKFEVTAPGMPWFYNFEVLDAGSDTKMISLFCDAASYVWEPCFVKDINALEMVQGWRAPNYDWQSGISI